MYCLQLVNSFKVFVLFTQPSPTQWFQWRLRLSKFECTRVRNCWQMSVFSSWYLSTKTTLQSCCEALMNGHHWNYMNFCESSLVMKFTNLLFLVLLLLRWDTLKYVLKSRNNTQCVTVRRWGNSNVYAIWRYHNLNRKLIDKKMSSAVEN